MTYTAPTTEAVRERQATAAEDWPTAYVALAESLNPVDTAPDPRERITSDAFNEGWECRCGNDIMAAGFAPCDPATGAEVEPTIDGPWDGKSVGCGQCGRVMDQTTNRRGPDGTWTVAVVAQFPPATDWEEVGRAAFKRGDPAAPALNPQVTAALAGRPVGDPENLRVMGGFSAGWTKALLAAPE